VPTVTDADVVLGLLRPEAFLGGRMPLDRHAALTAMRGLADQIGLSVEDTAAGILEINNVRAATAIRQQTLERGHDPRDYVLYAYGGAGPVHAFGYAAASAVREVVIPLGNGASTLSAYGIASGDVVLYRELERGLPAPFEGERAEALTAAVTEVEVGARADLQAAGFGHGDVVVEVDALMRFRDQLMHSLEIPVSLPAGPETGRRMLADFIVEYVRFYSSGGTAMFQSPEVFAFRARASVAGGVPTPVPAGEHAPPRELTDVYWPGRGWTATDVHRGVPAGLVSGPALVELAHTSIAVPPGASLATGSRNEVHLHLPTVKEASK
jgi:N-methylhydantoinase A